MKLFELQQQFQAWLLIGNDAIQAAIVNSDQTNALERLTIYQDAYKIRLLLALDDSFPALHKLMGDEQFQDIGLKYLTHSPSRHKSIRDFGDSLAEYIIQHTTYHAKYRYCEMAQFEWQLKFAFDAADISALSIGDIQKIPPEQWAHLTFDLHPSLSRLNLDWNIPQIWTSIDESQTIITAKKDSYPIGWLIWRHQLKTFYRSLAVDEAWAIDAIFTQHDFEDICIGLCEWIDEHHAAERAASLLMQWLNDGLITGIHINQKIS